MENEENGQVLSQEEQKPAKPKKEKLPRKERRKRWKAAKKARRDAEKEYYRYAPWGKRVWNLYLKKPVLGILGFLLAAALLIVSFSAIVDLCIGLFSDVKDAVAKAVAQAAIDSGVARI